MPPGPREQFGSRSISGRAVARLDGKVCRRLPCSAQAATPPRGRSASHRPRRERAEGRPNLLHRACTTFPVKLWDRMGKFELGRSWLTERKWRAEKVWKPLDGPERCLLSRGSWVR